MTGISIIKERTRFHFSAEQVVPSAGAYGSPEILSRPGIRPEADLQKRGIPVIDDLPGVGQTLMISPPLCCNLPGHPRWRPELRELAAIHPLMEERAIAKLHSPFAGAAPTTFTFTLGLKKIARLTDGWRCIVPVGVLRPRSRG